MKKKWLPLMLFVVMAGLICTISCTSKGMLFDLKYDNLKQIKGDQIERERVMNRHLFMHEAVIFGLNKAVLSSSAKALLDRKVDWLQNNPEVIFLIEGHCDSLGNEAYNLVLGERRGEVVKSYMVKKGIEGSRISIVSYGERDLVDCGKSEEELVKNRRVRFSISN